MATKKTTTKKKATARKATSKKKAPAKTAPPKQDLRVFAMRVSDAELAAIHKAAGPRNATRFMRAVAAAFADGDVTAFKKVLAEAEAARG